MTGETGETDKTVERTIEQLQSFVRGELAAIETYQQALDSPEVLHDLDTLKWCQRSHGERVGLLGEELRRLGAEVPTQSGAAGKVIELLGNVTVGLGESAAIYALEKYEDLRLREYGHDLAKLGAEHQEFVARSLLPAQIETHRILQLLKRRRAA